MKNNISDTIKNIPRILENLSKYFLFHYIWKFPYTDEKILNMPKKEYPNYLKKKYFIETGKFLHLKKPRYLSERIQWLKLYDNTPMKTQLTDKILARDWIKERIGEEYLKQVYWVGDNFDDIPFDTLPNEFYIKTNHGCKWHMYIKDKNKFLSTPQLLEYTKQKFNLYMKSKFGLQGLELQYLDIIPKLFIEENVNKNKEIGNIDIEVWCLNGKPKYLKKIKYDDKTRDQVVTYDENYNAQVIKTIEGGISEDFQICDNLKKAKDLSEKLAKDFKLVRVDWFSSDGKLYFNEMTFTPCAGFFVKEIETIKNEKICYNETRKVLYI